MTLLRLYGHRNNPSEAEKEWSTTKIKLRKKRKEKMSGSLDGQRLAPSCENGDRPFLFPFKATGEKYL